jgi:hypothetical protein
MLLCEIQTKNEEIFNQRRCIETRQAHGLLDEPGVTCTGEICLENCPFYKLGVREIEG